MFTTLQDRLSQLIEECGSLTAVSEKLNINKGYLSRLHSGEKTNPSEEVLLKLGLKREVLYSRVLSKLNRVGRGLK